MLLTALLSFASLQLPVQSPVHLPVQPSQAMIQLGTDHLSEQLQHEWGVSSSQVTLRTFLSPSTEACSTASYSRRSSGGTGRRQVLS